MSAAALPMAFTFVGGLALTMLVWDFLETRKGNKVGALAAFGLAPLVVFATIAVGHWIEAP